MRKRLSLSILLALSTMMSSQTTFAASNCIDGWPVNTKQYDQVSCPVLDYVLVTKNRESFLLDKKGEIFKKLPYGAVFRVTFSDYYKTLNQEGRTLKWGIIDYKGDVVLPNEYFKILDFESKEGNMIFHTTKIEKNGSERSDFFDSTGKKINTLSYITSNPVYKPQIFSIVRDERGYYNFIDYNGKEILTKPYDDLGDIHGTNYLVVGRRLAGGTQYGVYDLTNNKEITPFQEGFIKSYHNGIAIIGKFIPAKRKHLYAFMNFEGKYITDFEFDEAKNFVGNLAIVTKDKKVGLIDKTTGKIVLPIKYKEFGDYSDGMAAVVDTQGYVGYVDHQGTLVIPIEYGAGAPFKNGLAAVYKNGQEFFINKQNQVITKQKYDSTGPYRDGLAQVSIKRKVGLINTQGVEVLAPQFDSIEYFYNNVAVVRNGSKYGLINDKGQIVLPTEYDFLDDNLGKHKATIVAKNNKYALINNSGKILSPINYDDISPIKGNTTLFTFKRGKESGYMDVSGNHYDAFDEIGIWSAYRVKKGNKYGIISGGGTITHPVEYDYIGLSTEHGKYLAFNKAGKAGFFHSGNLKIAIDPKYDEARDFVGKTAFVKFGGKWGMIDNFEKVIIPFEYDDIRKRNDGTYLVKSHGGYGVIDENNKVIIPTQFDEIGYFSEGLAYIVKNGKYGFINTQGKVVITPQFDAPHSLSLGNRISYFGRNYYTFINGEAFVVQNSQAFDIDTSGKRIVRSVTTYDSGSYTTSNSSKTSGSHRILNETIKRDNAVFNDTEYYYVEVRCANGKNYQLKKYLNAPSKSGWDALGNDSILYKNTRQDKLDKAIEYVCN